MKRAGYGVCMVFLVIFAGGLVGQASEQGYDFDGTRNADWTPIEQDFEGVTMVLVPAGCFIMGSTDERVVYARSLGVGHWVAHEQPHHEQCFEAPFWIDKYEVTQGQFASLGGVKAHEDWFEGDNRPVERITWFEARDFCALRGGGLPTEAQWEYAARGVEAWNFPWGDEWAVGNVVTWFGDGYRRNRSTAEVGGIVAGASWVGAMDMAGNVWEWTSSLYMPYPYDAEDGREEETHDSPDLRRVFRGGSAPSDVTEDLRSAGRGHARPTDYSFHIGFRCVRDG